MYATRILLPIMILAALALGGCQYGQKPNGDLPMQQSWGDSYRRQLALQRMDAEPAAPTPVTGLDGKRAAAVVEGYQNPGTHEDSVAKALETLMKASQ